LLVADIVKPQTQGGTMKRNDNNRVLGRIGARELSAEELANVNTAAAGPLNTNVITFNPKTGQRDGDGE
jgi:hypothetical protein